MKKAPTLSAAGALALLLAAPTHAIDVVVGDGTPASCTEAAFAAAIDTIEPAGGTITFSCGGAATITLTSRKDLFYATNPTLVYAIDGGGNITLSGGGTSRILLHASGTLNLRNITLSAGLAQGAGDDASGGALWSEGAFLPSAAPVRLNLVNVIFTGNATRLTAPLSGTSPFDFGGGALFTRWGIVTITGCTFTGNTAHNSAGGAVHGRSSTITISGSSFSGNVSNGAGFGGALWVDGLSPTAAGTGGTLQVSTSSFTSNSSRNQGGAIGFYLYPTKNESATFDTVSVIGNQVPDASGTYRGTNAVGGGIMGDQGNLTIRNSTIARNLVTSAAGVGQGGGLYLVANGLVTVTNTTISENRALGATGTPTGGGLVIAGNSQPFQITHSTIAFNHAAGTGGGINKSGGQGGTITNTIVANNTADAFPPNYGQCVYDSPMTNGGGVLEFPANAPAGCVGGARITANPLLGSLAANGGFAPTHLPYPGSPAIDAGTCVIARDQRGVTRPIGSACDLGSVETGTPPPASTALYTLAPCRVLDTRLPSPTGGLPLICGLELSFTVPGSCGVPSGTKAVVANVTAVDPSKAGYLTTYATGGYPPLTATVNYRAGVDRANAALVPLNASGQASVRCGPSGTSHVVVDLTGYFQ